MPASGVAAERTVPPASDPKPDCRLDRASVRAAYGALRQRAEGAPLSTHGYALNEVGGNVPTAPGTHPEIAAAAVSPTQAVIQYEG